MNNIIAGLVAIAMISYFLWHNFIVSISFLAFVLLSNKITDEIEKRKEKKALIEKARDEEIEILQSQLDEVEIQMAELKMARLEEALCRDRVSNNLPRCIGSYYKKEIFVDISSGGIRIKWDNIWVDIKYDMLDSNQYKLAVSKSITLNKDEAISALKKENAHWKYQSSVILEFKDEPKIQVLWGPYGPYVRSDGRSYPIPYDLDAKTLNRSDCEKLIASAQDKRNTDDLESDSNYLDF